MHYINLGILIGIVGLLVGFYIHTDKKIDRLSDEVKSTHKELSDRIDRLYDIQVHTGMGLRLIEHGKDKAANE